MNARVGTLTDALAVFLQTPFWVAAAAYFLLATAVWILGQVALARTEHALIDWWLEHLAIPLGYAAAMIAFLLLAYPALYGAGGASLAELHQVMTAEPRRANHLLNLIFLTSLFASFVPWLGTRSALVVSLQGVAGAALLFGWAAGAHTVSYWPGLAVLTTAVAIAVAGQAAIGGLIGFLSRAEALGSRSLSLIAQLALLVVALFPVLIYGAFLGRQLT